MKFYVATELYLNEVRAFHDAFTHHYKPMVTQFLKDWGVKNKDFKYSKAKSNKRCNHRYYFAGINTKGVNFLDRQYFFFSIFQRFF